MLVVSPVLAPLIGLMLVVLVYLRMRPRRFYFIRHGETVLNAQHVRQGAEGSLSDEGREQATRVGRHLKRFHISNIIASTYERAKETATLMNAELHVPIIYSGLFVERRNPSEIIGKHRDLPAVKKIIDQIELAYYPDDYRYSDEENFADLKKRARKSLNLLARQGVNGTVIVTHHVFLKILLSYMLYREKLQAANFVKLSFFNFSDNATITVCDFHPWKMFSKTRGWEVVSYNEQPEDATNKTKHPA